MRREQLLASILDTATRGPGTSLMAARALHVVFAFEVATANGTLRQYLGAVSVAHLRYLAIVYQAFGASGFANAIFDTLAELECGADAGDQQQCLAGLEMRLFATVDPLHELIAQLTQSVH